MHGNIGEGDLEILVPIFAGTMVHTTVGVVGSRDETAVGDKMFVGGETFDAVDFEIECKGRELADSWDIQKVLDVVIGNEGRMERLLQCKNMPGEHLDLFFK